ncbi:9668_t:CDS:10 [Ambispora leptoticha]|uniref:alpha-1,2-Mannosidase n=1 Tax=Ambispora leptoticha TaxID=144679 RepID=A0A9N8VB71_9GLOM|nr:9668_t:CDS:10 [Ambispora leptoticha]
MLKAWLFTQPHHQNRENVSCLFNRWKVSVLQALFPISYNIMLLYSMHDTRDAGETSFRTQEMFYHGFDNYMKHAFPDDELNPIQCIGRGSDKQNPQSADNDQSGIIYNLSTFIFNNIMINDVLGDYSLTLVDSLDTFVVLGDKEKFENAVRKVIDYVSFDVNNKVQVFELNIRALGSLLSAHLFATDPQFGFTIDWYKNELLDLASDLGERLLLAFGHSKTGLPFPRVNLKYGVPQDEIHETCTAGAGTLILEFGVLSRLTNDPRFENAARASLFGLWNRRTDLDLLGNVINIQTGQWIHTASSTGAGIDSFFEYLLKAYVLFGESEYLDVFSQAYSAILRYIRDESGYLYRNVNIFNGGMMSSWVDSLSAYFPGLQVLAGDLENAIRSHLLYYNLWRKYNALPERFNFQLKNVEIGAYPLRPEFIESTYFLYRATRDPFYLEVGEMVLKDLQKYTRVSCGFANLQDVLTKKTDERMESFALSETFKYLYLLFDTEAHILPLPRKYLRLTSLFHRKLRGIDASVCPAYQAPRHLLNSVSARPDVDYAKELVGYEENILPELYSHGYCEVPQTDPPVIEISFGESVSDKQRSQQIHKFLDGIVVDNLHGLKLELTRKADRKGYEATRVDDYRIFPGQILEIRDPAVSNFWIKQQTYDISIIRVMDGNNSFNYQDFLAASATFGQRVTRRLPVSNLVHIASSPFGCSVFSAEEQDIIRNQLLMVKRGGCTFVEKVLYGQNAGARAVIVVSDDNHLFQPALPSEVGALDIRIPCVLVTFETGLQLEKLISHSINTTSSKREHLLINENNKSNAVYVTILPKPLDSPTFVKKEGEHDARLTINGHIIHNIRLNADGK